ncbi:MAG: hypothetical protein KDA86_09065 [Planctomycetaceae bacterium]|nr:hypothetical protein [Planctomycetaceae bacterium]
MSSTATKDVLVVPKGGSGRITSLDQFRGYTVLGMFLVNYLGSFAACPKILLHTHDYISYADTIMPHFLFAVGFSFRLTFGRRAQKEGLAAANWHMVRRMLGLALVSIVIYHSGPPAETWAKLTEKGFSGVLPNLLKREWFQTLMHIAVTSLWILPVIRAGAGVRIGWMVFSALLHFWLSYWFNFEWTNGSGPFEGTGNGIDGGPLGFLTWTIPAILGTLACDAVAGAEGRPNLWKMLGWSFIIMGLGWLISCGTRIYDVPTSVIEAQLEERTARKQREDEAQKDVAKKDRKYTAGPEDQKLAANPVIPSKAELQAYLDREKLSDKLAEPPFVPPPHSCDPPVVNEDTPPNRGGFMGWLLDPNQRPENNAHWYRKWNYWMMSQRGGTPAYLVFSGGFSLFVYVLFYVACDILGWSLGIFRSFGVNALAAYILHSMVGGAIKPFVPKDVPGWYMTVSVLLFFLINWIIIRHLEKQKLFLKL